MSSRFIKLGFMLTVSLAFMDSCFKWPWFSFSKFQRKIFAFAILGSLSPNITLKNDQKQANWTAFEHMRESIFAYSQGGPGIKINSMIFLQTCSERLLLTKRTITNVVIYQIHARASVQTRQQPAIIYILGARSSCRTERNK